MNYKLTDIFKFGQTSAERSEMDKQKIILIVDDQQRDLDMLVELLKPDYRIVAAAGEAQALTAVRDGTPPDLILLGITKPEKAGYDVCRRFKANQTTRDIPVILTASHVEVLALESGAVDCITKPIVPPILKARIKTQLALREKVDELREANIKIETLKNTMGTELTVGREIQQRIVPSDFPAFPDHDEFDVYATLQPARVFSGDFYDFFLIGDDRFCFCIGNVEGKGVQAALFMSVTKTIINSRAGDDFSTASILTHVNEQLSAVNQASMSVTLFMGILNIKTGRLLYTNAEHNPPYLKRATGAIELLDRIHGPVMGIARGVVYREDKTTLSKNDMLLLGTAGLVRAGIDEEKRFSEKRLRELLTSREYESVQHIVRATISEVKKITDGVDQTQDMTFLAVQFIRTPEEAGGPKLELTIPNRLSESAGVKAHFDTFAEQYGIPDQIRLKMHVVLDELLTNVISYAYLDGERHDIGIKVELSADRLKVSMVDDGIPFNPLGMETPDTELALEDRKIGGLGIHLVRKMMDRVSYRRRIEKNVITVLKFLNTDNN
jgi:sigma-B regulation protein RsbU (phosphoserine phosphatase)